MTRLSTRVFRVSTALADGAARRRRVCVVATVPFAMRMFMRPHVRALAAAYDVTLVTSDSADALADLCGPHVRMVPIAIERRIAPWKDSRALLALWRLFREERFDAVHSIMPKAGLIAMLAARRAGVPLRMHTFTGQVWVTERGPMAALLRALDRVLAANATHLLADSDSQRRFLLANGVASRSGITVLADGSIAGVDAGRFAFDQSARTRIRDEYGIPDTAVVFMFLGRLKRDKGIADLTSAFATMAPHDGRAHLFIVGPDEDRLEEQIAELGRRFPLRVHRAGYTTTPEAYLSCADVLCLPSHREGFPNVPLQAAAAGVPTVGSRIYGMIDAVQDGVTGVLHEPGSSAELAEAMVRLSLDAGLRRRLGDAARQRVLFAFPEARLTAAFLDYYDRAFTLAGL